MFATAAQQLHAHRKRVHTDTICFTPCGQLQPSSAWRECNKRKVHVARLAQVAQHQHTVLASPSIPSDTSQCQQTKTQRTQKLYSDLLLTTADCFRMSTSRISKRVSRASRAQNASLQRILHCRCPTMAANPHYVVCICDTVCLCVCAYYYNMCMCVCVCVCIWMCICVCLCASVCLCVFNNVYMCVSVCVQVYV